ncbi:phosphotransferase family protein [Nocardia carnea]|nr:phosphotransferase family protein [Nocardia carnea]
MNTVPGEALPRRLHRDPGYAAVRAHLAEDFGYVLGLIHRTPVTTLTALDNRDPLDAIEETYRDLAEPRPAVEIALRWLRDNRPPDRPAVLVHGDFRLGNMLIDADGIRGVLDWELAHLGNPIEDLGWLCVRAWRFGAAAPVGGLGTRDQLIDGYERATGDRPPAAELHWWEVFGTLKWLVLSRFQAERHLGGTEYSLELAAIGRRVCESEYDLLEVLGLVSADPGGNPMTDPAPTIHDRPDLTEILDLVTQTLTEEIGPALPEDAAAQRYLLRICASLLQIGGRELRAGPGPTDRVHEMLHALDCPSEATLAERLRSGDLSVADKRVRSTVTAAVEARLQVANPRRLG